MLIAGVILLVWLFFGTIAADIAYKKGRGGCGWLVLGLFFGPITILAAAMISPDYRVLDERAAAKRQRQAENDIQLSPAVDIRLQIFAAALVLIVVILVAVNSGSSSGPSQTKGNEADVQQNNAANTTSASDNVTVENSATVSGLKENGVETVNASEDSASEAPSFDSNAYCSRIGNTAGDSYIIEQGCRTQEAQARSAIAQMDVPARIQDHCRQIGDTAGGSYTIYKGCVELELQARSQM